MALNQADPSTPGGGTASKRCVLEAALRDRSRCERTASEPFQEARRRALRSVATSCCTSPAHQAELRAVSLSRRGCWAQPRSLTSEPMDATHHATPKRTLDEYAGERARRQAARHARPLPGCPSPKHDSTCRAAPERCPDCLQYPPDRCWPLVLDCSARGFHARSSSEQKRFGRVPITFRRERLARSHSRSARAVMPCGLAVFC
jgi:hypothetical protein